MKTKFSLLIFCLLVFSSFSSMGISLLAPSNIIITYPQLSIPDYGVSHYNITQDVTYEVVLNFTFTHRSGPNDYWFRFARFNTRMPNSSLTRYCPPYQESKLNYSKISSNILPAEIKEGHHDKFNNTYDSFNATNLAIDEIISFDQRYIVKLNAITFQDIDPADIGVYDTSDEMFELYNKSEPYYEKDDPSLFALSYSIVDVNDSVVVKAEKIYNWVSNNIVYNRYLPDQEMGALWAYENLQGDCSEYSSLMVTLLRIQGIPARKVTGFVISNNPSTRPSVGQTWNYYSTESVTTILGHAWVEYYVPEIGWIACDPTWASGGNYFNSIDLLRFNVNVGANFLFPPLEDLVSEFGNPGIVYYETSIFEYNYNVKVTVLESNLAPLAPFPLFVVIFIGAGVAVVLIAIILIMKRKKEIISYEY
ncbi:MAG: transglutaminase family protein [Candidatus Thorarchaeota archaeon]